MDISPSETVRQCASAFLDPERRSRIATPFGTDLHACNGRYVVGDDVLAPGIDECSPWRSAEVLAVGMRREYPGTWYLLHALRDGGMSLVEEQALRPLARVWAWTGRQTRPSALGCPP